MKMLLPCAALAFAFIAPLHASFDHSHALFTGILEKNVHGKNIDYAALHKDPDKLGSYLSDLSKIAKSEFNDWSKDQQKAFLINLYNAATIKLIVDNYPVKSIKDIDKPWKQKRIELFGGSVSLDYIEHEVLRKNYDDPRIHFGINCASIGCPAIRAEAFRAEGLDNQLNEQTRNFLADASKNRVDTKNKKLNLSSIFDWFEEDFVKKSGSVEKFIAPYLSETDRQAVLSGKVKIQYIYYDWSLNKI